MLTKAIQMLKKGQPQSYSMMPNKLISNEWLVIRTGNELYIDGIPKSMKLLEQSPFGESCKLSKYWNH